MRSLIIEQAKKEAGRGEGRRKEERNMIEAKKRKRRRV